MLHRIHELASAGQNFAFETTLASRTFAPFLQELKKKGYTCSTSTIFSGQRQLLLPIGYPSDMRA